jgi:superfamily II DNA or RNA helicase
MRFRDLDIQPIYDSVRDDLYADFFSPVLSNSVECMRVGGTFTSKTFLKIAQGMKDFIMNDGRMKLVLLPNFSKKDLDAINSGLKDESNVLLENWIEEYSQIEEKFVKDHTKALAWMLKKEYLEIKIVKITDSNGKIVRLEDLKNISLLKQQIGIFCGIGNKEFITFRGNLDYDENTDYSRITTYRYWDSSEEKYCNEDYAAFERFWEGDKFEYVKNYTFQSISIPKALKENLIQIAPEEKSGINLERPLTLRKMQKEAIGKWQNNNFNGIYEMATGTGKTRAAIGSIKKLEDENEKFITIIVVPTDTLGVQWKNELEKWDYKTTLTMKNPNWKQDIQDLILLHHKNKINNLCVVTSYSTFANYEFQEILLATETSKFLIADEVHHIASPYAQNGLMTDYKFRLGLTATLKRYFDEPGTKIITDFFHGVVFKYTMSQAIKDGHLCKYKYHIREVDLTEEEYLKYHSETLNMAKLYNKIEKDFEIFEKYQRAAERRANIIKSAFNKFKKLNEIINKRKKLDFALIYCNHDQIDHVQKILNDHKPRSIFNRKITEKDTPTREEKEQVFRGMLKGDYDVILAIKILDEGWDCPEIKTCILMASSGNEKQYIQRRGRVLRPFKETYHDGSHKPFAEIYDLCVLPNIPDGSDEDVNDMEQKLAAKELVRMEIMAESSMNSYYCNKIILKMRKKYGLEKNNINPI